MSPRSAVRAGRDQKVAALAVLNLAHQVSTGEVALPCDGQGPIRVQGRVVVPAAVHAVICGFHTSIRWDTTSGPPVAECRGCGLLRIVDDDGACPEPPGDEPVADVLDLRRSVR